MIGRRCLMLVWAVVGLSACGTAAAPSQSPATADERKLERAIDADAQQNARSYVHGRLRFTIYTQCNPTSPDLDFWRCLTTVESSLPYAQPCQIVTQVRSRGASFLWTAPVPFATLTTDEQCGTLHSELPIN